MSVVIQDTLVDLGTADLKTATPLSHRNLIINGDFRINQRGATSRDQTSSAYNYDRWYWDGTYLYQGVEDKNVRNGTFTLSWTDSGSDISAHYVISTDSSGVNGPDSGLTYTSVSNGGQITVNEGTEYSKHLWIRFGGTVANLSKVQLEEGSVATPFEHRSYGDELQRCFRYYEQWDCIDGENVLMGTSYGGQPSGLVKYVARKRTAPAVTLPTAGQTSGTVSFLNGTGGYPTTTGTHSTSQVTDRGLRIVGASYSGLSNAQPSTLFNKGLSSFKFDAEL